MQLLTATQIQSVAGGDKFVMEMELEYTIAQMMSGLQNTLDTSNVNYQFETEKLFEAIKEAGLDPDTYTLRIQTGYSYQK